MRIDAFADGEAASPAKVATVRWRAGSPRFALWNCKGVGLILAMAILVPWLLMARRAPASHPSGRAVGVSRVPILSLAFAPDGRSVATTDEGGFVTLWQ